MEKILTVSVAAYNVEKTIARTLDSCCADGVREQLEVIIVNDGSKDGTVDVVRSYCKRYPDTFKLIDKENGGYGSTLNCSIRAATGKYFKPLDGDDWFDKEGIKKLVNLLAKSDADIVITGRTLCKDDGSSEHSFATWETEILPKYISKKINITDLQAFRNDMWRYTIRTNILKEHPFELPEHCLYTDALFVAYPMPYIRTVIFQDYDVYCYHIGDNEQSVSIRSRIMHIEESRKVFKIMYDYYCEHKRDNLPGIKLLTMRTAQSFHNYLIRPTLLLSVSTKNLEYIRDWDKKIKKESPELFALCGQEYRRIRWYRKTFYQFYWFEKIRKQKAWY